LVEISVDDNPQLSGLSVWPTLEEFYADDERRRKSEQVDFPAMNQRWTDRVGWRWIMFFMPATGEFVAQRVDHGRPMTDDNDRGPVTVLGAIPRFARRPSWRAPLVSNREVGWGTGDVFSDLNWGLADVIVGDVRSLTRDPDFMAVLRARIEVGSRLVAALFRDPESRIYDLPMIETARRIEIGEVRVAPV
jgi:hypothetical protein